MAKAIHISLYGREDAELRIKQCKELLDSEEVQDAILPAAELVRDIAKHLCPVGKGIRTGKANKGEPRPHLRDVIFASKGKRRRRTGFIGATSRALGEAGPSVVAGVMGAAAPHAHLVERGHGGPHPAPAHPFMRPAAAAVRPAVVQIIESALKRLLAPFSR